MKIWYDYEIQYYTGSYVSGDLTITTGGGGGLAFNIKGTGKQL